jgi:hypothetical protein
MTSLPHPRCQLQISGVEMHPRQREIEVRLILHFVVRLKLFFRLLAQHSLIARQV